MPAQQFSGAAQFWSIIRSSDTIPKIIQKQGKAYGFLLLSEQWLAEYNAVRPHQALDNLTPHQYAARNG